METQRHVDPSDVRLPHRFKRETAEVVSLVDVLDACNESVCEKRKQCIPGIWGMKSEIALYRVVTTGERFLSVKKFQMGICFFGNGQSDSYYPS